MTTSSNYSADTFVTAANPAPGRQIVYEYPVRSGTQWTVAYTTRSDGGIGQNVYIAGGLGPGGVIPVSQTNPTSISLSGVTIGGVLEVTTSAGNPVEITGSVYVLNQSSGSGGGGMLPASGSVHYSIAFSTLSTPLLSANASRKALSIYNDSDQTYLVRLGTGASTTSWSFSLFPQQFYESPYPGFTGDVSGIGYTSGSGTIHVEEMT
jgi:hypothetical protein